MKVLGEIRLQLYVDDRGWATMGPDEVEEFERLVLEAQDEAYEHVKNVLEAWFGEDWGALRLRVREVEDA